MYTKLLASLFLIAAFSTGCDKSTSTTKSGQVEAAPFHGEVYRSYDGQSVLTLISPDECELLDRTTTFLCKYTKQTDTLRVVVTAMGANQVLYYRFTNQGIQDNNGRVLLSPTQYTSAVEQVRLEQERQTRIRQEAEQLKLAEINRRRTAHEKEKSNFLGWVREYFGKGKTYEGAQCDTGFGSAPPYTYPFKFTALLNF